STFDEEEVFLGVEGLPKGGVFGDQIALVEEGIQFRVEKCTGAKWGDSGGHKVRPWKMIQKTL
ncbi:MAG: hypothetical protein FWE95_06315, partial [Planctomycetaceae bacterium]|nr:hypothetical protein [Planctomycetaceae bacterium]